MILQEITDIETIIGIGLSFSLAFIFTAITKKDIHSFLCFLLFFMSFIVWSGLLPIWVLILNVIGVLTSLFIKIRTKISGGI